MSKREENEITEELEEQPKRRRFYDAIPHLWRVIALAVTVVMLVGAVYLVVNRDKISFDAFRRMIAYHKTETDENGLSELVTYSGDMDNCFGVFEDGLLSCSATQMELFSRSGQLVLEQTVNIAQPAMDIHGDYAVVYDINGEELYLLHDGGITQSYKASSGHILSARVNSSGWITIVEQATGYKASVTVYNAAFQPKVTENISSAYVMDAAVSPDNSQLALVTIGEDSEGFSTVIQFYNVKDGEESGRCVLGSDVVLDLNWQEEALWLEGEYGVYCVQDGAITGAYTDSTRYLQEFSLGGDGYAALYFSKYQGGNAGSLTLRSVDGSESSIGINEEVLSISASGNYLAVLTNSMLTIYDRELGIYATLTNGSARRVLMRSDGSAILVSAGSAQLFLVE